ncbi:hypothetical protein DRE_03862 [Drechslerella stenobrocha 248]|uniref:DNA topoisomerase (ATP-hydrolyzing) n=1 Tax=Drechslerella stenobrocha 248 TaxID=1043628 RepID=W7ICK1_9PEZI|nr:hypothetical protein DRE_03862 [Drechslerella stenobrocha 248]
MDYDADEDELFSVIDLYERPLPPFIQGDNDDVISDYFGWSDGLEDIAISPGTTAPQLQPPLGETFLQPSIHGAEYAPGGTSAELGAIPLFKETPDITPQPGSAQGLHGSVQHGNATQEPAELPHISTVGGDAADSDGADSELDLPSRVHKLLNESRTDEVITIEWDGTDNFTRPPAFVMDKIDDVFSGFMDVITSKGRLVIKLRGHARKSLRCRKDPTRDIYYKHISIFRSQVTVDNLVDDIATALGVSRRTLHITAAAKGLVCGDLKICKTDGSTINCCIRGEGTLVPASSDIEKVVIGDCDSVLIIEKEVDAIFRTLAESGDWKRLPGRPILLCGKGYPDIATREFARYLYLSKNRTGGFLTLYCLVDYDPHGLDIYTMYKNGSLLFGARTQQQKEHMSVPTLTHLGIKFSDILDYCFTERKAGLSQGFAGKGLTSNTTAPLTPTSPAGEKHQGKEKEEAGEGEMGKKGEEGQEPQSKRLRAARRQRNAAMHQAAAAAAALVEPQGLLLMTAHDRAKAMSMLQRAETDGAADLRNLLFIGYKAEIQVLGDQLVRYLDEKLAAQRIGLAA